MSHPHGPPPLFAPSGSSNQRATTSSSSKAGAGAALNLDDMYVHMCVCVSVCVCTRLTMRTISFLSVRSNLLVTFFIPLLSFFLLFSSSFSSTHPRFFLSISFGDVMFTPDGDTVFLSEQQDALLNSGEGEKVATMASRMTQDGRYQTVEHGGGLYTTQLNNGAKPALQMGSVGSARATAPVPFQKNPQQQHQLQFAVPQKKSGGGNDEHKSERRYVITHTVSLYHPINTWQSFRRK